MAIEFSISENPELWAELGSTRTISQLRGNSLQDKIKYSGKITDLSGLTMKLQPTVIEIRGKDFVIKDSARSEDSPLELEASSSDSEQFSYNIPLDSSVHSKHRS